MTYTFRSLFRKAELDRDLDEELRSYLDLLTEKNRKAGMSLQEARRSAHLVMEGSEQVKEEVREVRMGAKIDALGLDFRYALRAVGKNPGFTLIVALILALGIGASTAIFSAVNGILLRPYPYRHPERILTLWRFETDKGTVGNGISPGNFLDIKEQSLAFSDMAIMRPYGLDFTGDGDPESFTTWLVSEGFFRIMGMNPLHGRTFLPAEFTAGHNRVVVFSYGLWQRRFGGDPGLVGRSIRLDEEAFLVVGIMPPEFRMPGDIEAFAPKVLTQQDRLDRRSDYQKAVARLKPDRTLEEAQVEIDLIAERLAQAYPKPNEGVGVKLRTWPEQMLGPIRMNLLVLLGAVFLVLLIACSNVANLFLARGTERQREFALRAALGAGGYRLIRQLLFESLLLALLGGAGGLFLAYWGTQVLVGLSPADIPRLATASKVGWIL